MDSRMNNRRRNYRYEKPHWELEKERAAREKEDARVRNLERTDENYPQLGKTVYAKPSWGGGKKFTELAKEWKKDEDERKANEEYEEIRKKREEYRGFVMPQFQLTHRYEEENEYVPVPPPSPVGETNDEWVSIDRSAKTFARLQRKQACEDERMKRRDAGIETSSESGSSSSEEESCWQDRYATEPMGKNAY